MRTIEQITADIGPTGPDGIIHAACADAAEAFADQAPAELGALVTGIATGPAAPAIRALLLSTALAAVVATLRAAADPPADLIAAAVDVSNYLRAALPPRAA